MECSGVGDPWIAAREFTKSLWSEEEIGRAGGYFVAVIHVGILKRENVILREIDDEAFLQELHVTIPE